MIYAISTLLLFLSVLTKITFGSFENNYSGFLFNIISILVLSGVLVYGSVNYFSKSKVVKMNKALRIGRFEILFLILNLFFIVVSLYINVNKKVLLWDSIALYDARAKFLMQDTSFSEMVDLSRFDPVNSYYYSLYPPFTSIVHFYWYKLKIPLNVSTYYTFNYLMLGVVAYFLTKKNLGRMLAIFLVFLTLSNYSIFSISLLEYTNLPYTLQMVLGIFLLSDYLKNKSTWKLLYGIALVVSSQWIRFLEPLWIGVILSFLVFKFRSDSLKKNLILAVLILLFGAVEYLSWKTFVSSFGQTTDIVNFSLIKIIEPMVGIFTGSLMRIAWFFVYSWGIIFLVHTFSILLVIKNKFSDSENFIQLALVSIILIYFTGLYFVSFQSIWWDKLGDSLVRSSTFMIPISAYLVLRYIKLTKNDK